MIRVFDYGPDVVDRYDIVIGDSIFTMSDNPDHPQGFNQYVGEMMDMWPPEQWRCEEITLADLPKAVLVAIIRRLDG